MPTYRITDPETGKVVKITRESPPTEEELNEIFSKVSGGELSYTGRLGLALKGGVKTVLGGAHRAIAENITTPEEGFLSEPLDKKVGIAAASKTVREGVADLTRAEEGLSYLAALPIKAVGSAPTTIAALGAGMINPYLGLGVAGLSQASATYGSEREQGLNVEDAAIKAITLGSVEAITEKIPIDVLIKVMKGSFRSRLLKRMAAEGIQESSVQAVEEAYDAGILDRKLNFWEALGRVADAGLVGSVAGAPTATFASLVEKDINEDTPKPSRAITEEEPQPETKPTEREGRINALQETLGSIQNDKVRSVIQKRIDELQEMESLSKDVTTLRGRMVNETNPKVRKEIDLTLRDLDSRIRDMDLKEEKRTQKRGLQFPDPLTSNKLATLPAPLEAPIKAARRMGTTIEVAPDGTVKI
ncbi:MAG: hypothetical protein ACREBU_13645, partial [Nitrososphaera sp.]